MNASPQIFFTFQSCSDINEIVDAIAMPRDIWGSTLSENSAATEHFAQQFQRVCALLPAHPEIALNRDDLSAGLRSILFHRYVIFFRVRGTCVEVLRVLRATRDVRSGVAA